MRSIDIYSLETCSVLTRFMRLSSFQKYILSRFQPYVGFLTLDNDAVSSTDTGVYAILGY